MTKKETLEYDILTKILVTQPFNEGGYRFISGLELIIAEAMLYPIDVFNPGCRCLQKRFSVNPKYKEKVHAIIAGMAKNNVIKVSKSGKCYKLTKEKITMYNDEWWENEYTCDLFTYKTYKK